MEHTPADRVCAPLFCVRYGAVALRADRVRTTRLPARETRDVLARALRSASKVQRSADSVRLFVCAVSLYVRTQPHAQCIAMEVSMAAFTSTLVAARLPERWWPCSLALALHSCYSEITRCDCAAQHSAQKERL